MITKYYLANGTTVQLPSLQKVLSHHLNILLDSTIFHTLISTNHNNLFKNGEMLISFPLIWCFYIHIMNGNKIQIHCIDLQHSDQLILTPASFYSHLSSLSSWHSWLQLHCPSPLNLPNSLPFQGSYTCPSCPGVCKFGPLSLFEAQVSVTSTKIPFLTEVPNYAHFLGIFYCNVLWNFFIEFAYLSLFIFICFFCFWSLQNKFYEGQNL